MRATYGYPFDTGAPPIRSYRFKKGVYEEVSSMVTSVLISFDGNWNGYLINEKAR